MFNVNLIFSIVLVVGANALYHIASKGISAEQNAFMGLIVNYATALLSSILLFFLTSHNSIATEISRTNFSCILMGLSITAVEAGFVLIYRMGGQISTVSLIVNILLAILMLIIGINFYAEQISLQKIFGIIFCIIGIIIISI